MSFNLSFLGPLRESFLFFSRLLKQILDKKRKPCFGEVLHVGFFAHQGHSQTAFWDHVIFVSLFKKHLRR